MRINRILFERLNSKIEKINNGILQEKEYAFLLKKKMDKFTIIDIGANIGTSTYCFLKMLPNVKVVLFEPNKDLHVCLNYVANLYKNCIEIYPYALGNKNHHRNLFIPYSKTEYYSGLGSLNRRYAIKSYRNLYKKNIIKDKLLGLKKMSVQAICGDDILFSLSTDCWFIKIDTEGSENKVILGMINYIKKYLPILMLEKNSKYIKIPKIPKILKCYYDIYYYDYFTDIFANINKHNSRNYFLIPKKYLRTNSFFETMRIID